MKVWSLPSLQSVQSWQDLRRFSSQALTNFSQVLSRNVGFTDNINCQIVDIVIQSGVETKIPHTLGKVPIGYLLIDNDDFLLLAHGPTAWTDTDIYLISNLAPNSSATLRIVILGS